MRKGLANFVYIHRKVKGKCQGVTYQRFSLSEFNAYSLKADEYYNNMLQ